MSKETNTKEFVQIQSTINISVTAGLQNQDVTNKDAHVPDRLKVQPLWPKATVDIHEGPGIYPAYIVEWATVKALAKDKILTIGQFVDNASEAEKQVKETLDTNMDEIAKTLGKKVKDVTLNELVGE